VLCLRQPGRTDFETASVVVERYRLPAVRVRLAHASRAASDVVDIAADVPDTVGFGGMLSNAAVLEYASEPRIRPVLILEPTTELSEPTPAGEQRNLLVAGLLGLGLTQLRAAGQLPPLADGWEFRLGASGGQLLAPAHTVIYDGPIDRPPSWQQLVRGADACVVLIGTVGLHAHAGDELDTGELRGLCSGRPVQASSSERWCAPGTTAPDQPGQPQCGRPPHDHRHLLATLGVRDHRSIQ